MSKEDKKRLKEYQKKYREAKNIFHKCRYANKNAFCYREDIFFSFFY